jgi:hypothetical protein
MRGQFCAELRSPIGKAVIIGGQKGIQQGRRGRGGGRSEEAEHYGTSSNGHNCIGRIILHADHCREFVKILKLHFKLEYPLNLMISAEQNTGK